MNTIINNSIYFNKNTLNPEDKKDIILDLSIKDPFADVPSIPIDAKSVFNKNEEFIDQVRNQSFLVLLDGSNEYYNKTDLKNEEILVMNYTVEDKIAMNITKEKSGISLIDNESKDIKVDNNDKLLSTIDKFLINYKN